MKTIRISMLGSLMNSSIHSCEALKSNIEILKNSGKGGVIVSRMPPENLKSIGAGIAE